MTGALGQIGSELVLKLRDRYGSNAVIASDIRAPAVGAEIGDGPFEHLDCTQSGQVDNVVRRHQVGTIYHLAAILSAVAEEKPQVAWDINMGGLVQVLEAARHNRCALFFPSSIAAFGPTTPLENTPQDTLQRPTSMYGVTKTSGELLCDYYAARFGVDTRGLRLPGIISHRTPPGGGTTDYAVEIFRHAVRYRRYTCFLRNDTRLDMMYMPDATDAILRLMDADPTRLKHRNAFNVTAMNFAPSALAREICKHVPEFVITYEIDPVRQAIADSWPRSVDDGEARSQWDWAPRYDLSAMTLDMLDHLRARPGIEIH